MLAPSEFPSVARPMTAREWETSSESEDEEVYLKLRGKAVRRCELDVEEQVFHSDAEKQVYREVRLKEHLADLRTEHKERKARKAQLRAKRLELATQERQQEAERALRA